MIRGIFREDAVKIAIDSYCYHRYFGEIYPGLEKDPNRRMSLPDFIDRAVAHGVGAVSIESFMLGRRHDARSPRCGGSSMRRVWTASGPGDIREASHPARLPMRCGISSATSMSRRRSTPRDAHLRRWPEHADAALGRAPRLAPAPAARAADYAAERQVVLAIENHVDLLADEMLDLMSTVDHPALGVCLDTANNLRMFEDPVVVAEKLAPYVRAAHVKDVAAFRGSPRDFSFWPSVPLGHGLIDLPRILGILKRAGYDGLLALEIDYLHPDYPDDEAAIAQSLAYLRTALDTLPA